MPADSTIDGDVLVADFSGARIGGIGPPVGSQRRQPGFHVVQGPAQINRRRPRHHQLVIGGLQAGIRGLRPHGQRHAVSRHGPDQRRAAHLHRRDGMGRRRNRFQPQGHEGMG